MRLKRSEGQTILIVSIALPVLVGMMSFGLDLAYIYYSYTRIQTASDAAVLAGDGHEFRRRFV